MKRISAPGVLFLVSSRRPVSALTFLSALLGDFAVSFAVDTSEISENDAFFGRNGIFRPNHHTHISAVYLVDSDRIFFAANPYAALPIGNVLPQAVAIPITPGEPVVIPA